MPSLRGHETAINDPTNNKGDQLEKINVHVRPLQTLNRAVNTLNAVVHFSLMAMYFKNYNRKTSSV